MAEDEGLLHRWARRKAEARTETRAKAPPEPQHDAVVAEAPTTPPAAEAPPEAAGPAPPDLPDLDSLGPDSDYRAFMLPGVPGHLRRAALRKLWRADPVYANLDGLVDFGEDWTDAARVIPDLKTAYRVGRGLLRDLEDAEPAEVATDAAAKDESGRADADQPADAPSDPQALPDPTRT
jgi:hypothetical protein